MYREMWVNVSYVEDVCPGDRKSISCQRHSETDTHRQIDRQLQQDTWIAAGDDLKTMLTHTGVQLLAKILIHPIHYSLTLAGRKKSERRRREEDEKEAEISVLKDFWTAAKTAAGVGRSCKIHLCYVLIVLRSKDAVWFFKRYEPNINTAFRLILFISSSSLLLSLHWPDSQPLLTHRVTDWMFMCLCVSLPLFLSLLSPSYSSTRCVTKFFLKQHPPSSAC